MENTDEIEFYKLAIDARNYHFSMALKWMIFYAAIVGALFVGFYSVDVSNEHTKILISLLGFLSSFCWFLSARGYYYWINNWITVVLRFEKKIYKNTNNSSNLIYSLFFINEKQQTEEKKFKKKNKKIMIEQDGKIKKETGIWNEGKFCELFSGYNISTFKVTLFFIFNIMLSWLYLLIKEINFSSIVPLLATLPTIHLLEIIFSLFSIVSVIYLFLWKGIKSDVSKHIRFNNWGIDIVEKE